MQKRFFEIRHQSTKSQARRGVIYTSRGTVQTPAFVPVGTKGTIKGLHPDLFNEIGIQLSFVNTYHLVTHPGIEVIQKAGGIHRLGAYSIPLMSDSGGFQVFSLAGKKKGVVGTIATMHKGEESPYVVKISEDGVKFRSVFDGTLIEFTPETSMEYQQIIGADINMAFDECTYYPSTHEYAKKAMRRTHEWLKRCVDAVKKSITNKKETTNIHHYNFITKQQYLYGIIQGGTFEDLRKQSAEFVISQNVDGIAIGGVSVGETKKEMRDQVRWVAPYLPSDKPVHLLGVGQIDDIIDLVRYGIDTFDCVEPTRLARMGTILRGKNIKERAENRKSTIDSIEIDKGKYRNDLSAVDENCECSVCTRFTKAYLHHLFKQKELLGYTLATYHNLWVMEQLMSHVRGLIEQDRI